MDWKSDISHEIEVLREKKIEKKWEDIQSLLVQEDIIELLISISGRWNEKSPVIHPIISNPQCKKYDENEKFDDFCYLVERRLYKRYSTRKVLEDEQIRKVVESLGGIKKILFYITTNRFNVLLELVFPKYN